MSGTLWNSVVNSGCLELLPTRTSKIAPQHFGHPALRLSPGRVVRQFEAMAFPVPEGRLIESRGVTGKHDLALAFEQSREKFSVLPPGHLVGISVCRRSRFVKVWRVAVEKGCRRILPFDQLDRGHVLDEDPA